MNKPDTPLHERSYAEDWKLWVKSWLQENKYESLESAVKFTMKETRGLINPNWIKECWEYTQ